MPPTPTRLFHALISGLAFLAALIILALFLWNAETLVKLGLVGKLYYLVLVPLGLGAAAFLFGALKSYAAYKGQALGGVLELGGPVVAFVLVLVLGFILTPDPPFNVTVFAQREDRPVEPFRSGKLVLKLGGDPRTAALADNGAAYFIGIPASFKGQSVPVLLLEAPGYEIVQDRIKLDGEGVNLAVRPLPAVFKGHVRTTDGQPLPAARVSLASYAAISDTSGYFVLTVPGTVAENGATLQVTAPGFGSWSGQVNPGGNDIVAMLEKAK